MSAPDSTSREPDNAAAAQTNKGARPESAGRHSLFTTPASVKRIFSRFPLVTYPPNALPMRAPRRRDEHNLYIFTTASDAQSGAPSFNPSCLKWQALLKFHHIPFNTVPSSNHASPTGALPFLYASKTTSPIPSTSLSSWASTQLTNPRADHSAKSAINNAYHALLSNPIRLAYLHALYLEPSTFSAVVEPLYIHSCSSSTLVRVSLSWPLRAAALAEFGTASNAATSGIDVEGLYRDAEEALEALSVYLGGREWFEDEEDGNGTGSGTPSLLDAGVFAYTQVILSLFAERSHGTGEKLDGGAERLAAAVQAHGGLVRHRQRILQQYFETAGHETLEDGL